MDGEWITSVKHDGHQTNTHEPDPEGSIGVNGSATLTLPTTERLLSFLKKFAVPPLPPCPVRLATDELSQTYRVIVHGLDGAPPDGTLITKAMYDALSALTRAFPSGLTRDQLIANSGVRDPGKAIREAVAREPALRAVIRTPRCARRKVPGVYRIVRPAATQPLPRE